MTPILALDLGCRADVARPEGMSWSGQEENANGTKEDQLALRECHVEDLCRASRVLRVALGS